MAREIVTHLWCDVCDGRDEKTPGQPVLVSLDGKKPVELDLCEVHDKELLASLRELITEVGQPVDGALPGMPSSSPSSEKKSCPQCSKELTREGMRKHMMTFHEMDRPAAGDVVRELFGSRHTNSVKIRKCPECQDEFDTPQGLGAHRRSVHNVKGENSKAAAKA